MVEEKRATIYTPLRPRHSMMACASSIPASVSIMTSLALRAHDWPGAAGNTRCTWWRQAKKCYGGRGCIFLFPPMDAVKALFLRSPDRSAKVQAHYHPSPRAACTPHSRLPRSAGSMRTSATEAGPREQKHGFLHQKAWNSADIIKENQTGKQSNHFGLDVVVVG